MRRVLCLAASCLLVAACGATASPSPTLEYLRLPTRLPRETPTPTPFALAAELYVEQGKALRRAGETARARQYYTWAIRRDPECAKAYLARSSLFLALGNLEEALLDANAALALEATAEGYLLRGEVLRRLERYESAWMALGEALEREPGLGDETFHARWLIARALEDAERLSTLAAEYTRDHPEDSLRHYYRAWAVLEHGEPEEALRLLVSGLDESTDQAAVMWYLLGRAYVRTGAWSEAVVSLETARSLVEVGDTTLAIDTSQPVADLFVALGRAYLGAGRCVDAERMLSHGLSTGASMSEHLGALEEARICQTPTPRSDPTVPSVED